VTEDERTIARAIAQVTYCPGIGTKRFARDMANLAEHKPEHELTPPQRKYLFEVAVRFRRQVPRATVVLARQLLEEITNPPREAAQPEGERAMIKPTIGRRVWFYPNGTTGIPANGGEPQPHDAGIAYVWNDRLVNLTVAGHDGSMHARTSVPLLQDDDVTPAAGGYATWMPYQKLAAAAA